MLDRTIVPPSSMMRDDQGRATDSTFLSQSESIFPSEYHTSNEIGRKTTGTTRENRDSHDGNEYRDSQDFSRPFSGEDETRRSFGRYAELNHEGNTSLLDTQLDIGESKEHGRGLNLLEEIMLLGLKDDRGYLSFWNDSISYVLRGLILIELSFRDRITMSEEGRDKSIMGRTIRIREFKPTGEVLLDEALRLIRADETLTVTSWIDLLSGDSWNVLKAHYQLKRVRERLAKGLVDKGVLRTSKTNFIFFDMATHPITNPIIKRQIIQSVKNTLLFRGPPANRHSIALACASYAANVLDPVLETMTMDERDRAIDRANDLLNRYSRFTRETAKDSTEIMAAVINAFSTMDSFI
jgi:golgi phosphoprotein 3